jgi:DNA modification methylase
LDAIFPIESSEQDDVVPEPPEEPITQRGDIWQLGRHRVMCGDSTKVDDVERLMDGNRANISFQSPPYNAGDNALGGNKKMKKSKYLNDDDNKTSDEYLSFISSFTLIALHFAELSFVNIQQLAKNKKAVIEYLYAFRDHFVDRGIWFKGGGQPAIAESVMNSRFEDVYIFDCNKNPKRVIRTNKFRNISNVFEYNPSGKNDCKESHAATFPVAFPQHYITFATGINSIVLDLFLGSGSTLIACEKTNRICYGMEIDPVYVDVIIKRYEDFTGKKAERLCQIQKI